MYRFRREGPFPSVIDGERPGETISCERLPVRLEIRVDSLPDFIVGLQASGLGDVEVWHGPGLSSSSVSMTIDIGQAERLADSLLAFSPKHRKLARWAERARQAMALCMKGQ